MLKDFLVGCKTKEKSEVNAETSDNINYPIFSVFKHDICVISLDPLGKI